VLAAEFKPISDTRGTAEYREQHESAGREPRYNKARKGAVYSHPPIGYVKGPTGGFALDPDEQVQSIVRLLFEQGPGQPLIMTPRVTDPKAESFISVVNGGLEIVGGVFSIPASERQPLPKWFIQVVDGDLVGADVAQPAVHLEGELIHLRTRQPLERSLGHHLEPLGDVPCVPER
jgi:hypothetical protein